MRAFRIAVGCGVLLAVTFVGAAAGSPVRAAEPPPWAHDPGDSSANVAHDTSAPLRSLTPVAPPQPSKKKDKEPKKGPPVPAASPTADPVVQSTMGTRAAATPGAGFEGVGDGFTGPAGTFAVGSAPPDPNATVGPNNIFEVVNQSFAIFDKAGNVVYGPAATNTLWSGFGGGCQANDDGDATVVYDKLADRWVVQQFSVSTTPYLECLAISTSGDPTGSYYRYSFAYSNFPDYPKLGVWADAYYTTFNMFRSGLFFRGPQVCAFDRARMLTGQAATQKCFQLSASFGSMLPADLDGSTPPPAGSPEYLLSFTTNALQLWKFHVDWGNQANSTLTGPTTVPVAAFSPACNGGGTCIPQSGTTQQLDSLADRLMYRLSYRNFGDHESLLVDHAVTAGSSTGIRWYELRNPASAPSVYQQGTYAPDATSRWMGSVAMDHVGNIALGYSASSASSFPGIRYTGRLAGDPLGVMTQAETTTTTGGGAQDGGLSRWGDYTSMSVDPSDDCTFWYTNQYLATTGSFNWHTRIASFKFPGCSTSPSDFSLSASPSAVTVPAGSAGTSTISTSVTGGAPQAVALSASGLPAGATASFNPGSVTAGSSSVLTLTAGPSTPAGTYTVTVTGTGTSATHTTTVALTVSAAPSSDFSLAASPTTVSVVQGASATSTVSTAVTNGSAQSVSFSATGAPAGTTVGFAPSSITAGGSSTMTVTAGAATAPGTYTLTVVGSGTSATHTTTVTLTVTAAPADFSVSAAPASVSVAQGASGTSTISTAVTVGAAQSVALSASGLPAGATASFSPATVTAGSSSTLTLTVGASVAPGTYTVTVKATGTSATHTTSVALAVVASDFTVSSSPDSVTVSQGASGTSTISTAVASGAAQSVALGASGVPAGTTASFNPSTLNAGGSSTLTLAVGPSTAPGTYTVTVTATAASAMHTTSVSLTVKQTQMSVVNGDFETGDLSGWTASGAFAPAISTSARGGSYAAQLGSSGPVNGNSTLTETLLVPAGNSTLTYWYQPHCKDSLQFDQIQAQIRDTSGATLATVMNVCSNSGAWTSVGFDMTAYAGRTVVLWFNDHDDGYATDPTYFLLDDVKLAPYTVTPSSVQNGGFENGLTSWSPSGAFAPVVSSVAHSGTASAQIGSTGAVSGDSTLTQVVSVGAGTTTLTFWYQPHSNDSVQYDQQQVQIRSLSGQTLATVLNVCSNSGVWTQVTYDLTPFAGQTVVLWFNTHDDGFPFDPTYFLVDDVALTSS